jgi:hypothetical protein
MILTNCYIKVGTIVASGDNTSVAVNYSSRAVDMTAMGNGTAINEGGIKEWSMAFEFNASTSLIGALFAMVGTVIPVEVRADAGAVSASNPTWKGNALVTEYSPIDGSVGDKHTVSLSVVSAGPLTQANTAV